MWKYYLVAKKYIKTSYIRYTYLRILNINARAYITVIILQFKLCMYVCVTVFYLKFAGNRCYDSLSPCSWNWKFYIILFTAIAAWRRDERNFCQILSCANESFSLGFSPLDGASPLSHWSSNLIGRCSIVTSFVPAEIRSTYVFEFNLFINNCARSRVEAYGKLAAELSVWRSISFCQLHLAFKRLNTINSNS